MAEITTYPVASIYNDFTTIEVLQRTGCVVAKHWIIVIQYPLDSREGFRIAYFTD